MWLVDLASSHNITGNLANLSVHSEYDGIDEVILGDGLDLSVSHIGALTLEKIILRDILCIPNFY